jgi:hypothetical protein
VGSHYSPIVVTRSGDILIFTGPTAGYDFSGDSTIVNDYYTPGYDPLEGTVTMGAAYTYSMRPALSWSKQGESDQDELLQLMVNERAYMYRRSKQLIQMPIQEMGKALSLNILGNFQDYLCSYNGAICVFIANRGEFDIRKRKWMIDLFEIGTGEILDSDTPGTYTVDTTLITADNDIITVDNE